jgi:flagella basal body P-ring formation protein FlgA
MRRNSQAMKRILKVFILIALSLAGEGFLHYARAVTISGDTIKTVVENYIETNMPWHVGTMRVDFPARVPDVVLVTAKTGSIKYQVRSKKGEDFLGDSAFMIEFHEDGAQVKEEAVKVRMEILRSVVVSSRVLVRDTEISADDVTLVKKWVTEVPLNSVAGLEEVVGKRICTSIRPNTEITTNMLKDAIVIKKGKMVRILLDNGPVRVIGTGVSEENGTYKAMIKVKNTSSNKTIFARVEGESLVRVEFQQ